MAKGHATHKEAQFVHARLGQPRPPEHAGQQGRVRDHHKCLAGHVHPASHSQNMHRPLCPRSMALNSNCGDDKTQARPLVR